MTEINRAALFGKLNPLAYKAIEGVVVTNILALATLKKNVEIADTGFRKAQLGAALGPRVGSMRMSSGPSRRKLKPRAGSSSCIEDTPRSARRQSAPAR